VVSFAFRCSACGRCCNSPPEMTVDELFRHEHLFVGCLSLRRDAVGAPVLATQAHDYPSLARCPALAADGGCTLHDRGKPATCKVVPLDPRLPEGAQRVVLQRRAAEASWLQADCLVAGEREGHRPLVEGEHIVDAEFHAAFEASREALGQEWTRWGRELAEWMRPELARLPAPRPGGYLALSLVAILVVLSRHSPGDHARCRRYAHAQVALIEANVARAVGRRVAADRPVTDELRRFAAQYRAFAASPAVAG
jgi:Fe-S-cluster containining protein